MKYKVERVFQTMLNSLQRCVSCFKSEVSIIGIFSARC